MSCSDHKIIWKQFPLFFFGFVVCFVWEKVRGGGGGVASWWCKIYSYPICFVMHWHFKSSAMPLTFPIVQNICFKIHNKTTVCWKLAYKLIKYPRPQKYCQRDTRQADFLALRRAKTRLQPTFLSDNRRAAWPVSLAWPLTWHSMLFHAFVCTYMYMRNHLHYRKLTQNLFLKCHHCIEKKSCSHVKKYHVKNGFKEVSIHVFSVILDESWLIISACKY